LGSDTDFDFHMVFEVSLARLAVEAGNTLSCERGQMNHTLVDMLYKKRTGEGISK